MSAEPPATNPIAVLLEEASRAEEEFDFHGAYRLYVRAALGMHEARTGLGGMATGTDDERDLVPTEILFRGARALEKSQRWRAHTALWEYIGDCVGEQLYDQEFRLQTDRGHSEMFIVARDCEWLDPSLGRRSPAGRPVEPRAGYYLDDADRQKHRHAIAYQFAAEEATANRRFALSARLHRKAGIAWSLCQWGERTESDSAWGEEALAQEYGEKWRWAARSHFRAVLVSIRSDLYDEKNERLRGPYTPHDVGWPKHGLSPAAAEVFAEKTDLERMEFCWEQSAKAKQRAADTRVARATVEVDSRREFAAQLEPLQNELARAGRRADAIEVHRARQRLVGHQRRLEAELHRSLGHALRALAALARSARVSVMRFVSRNGTDVGRTLAVVSALYLIILPVLYWRGGLIVHHDDPGAGVGPLGTVTVSLASVAGLSVRDYVASSTAAAAIQVTESVLAYFLFGYVIWMFTRSYEEA